MSILPRLRRTTPVEEKCPLLAVTGNGKTTITKHGVRARVIELDGHDTGGLDPELVEAMYQERKMAWDSLPRTVEVLYQGHRVKRTKDDETPTYAVPMAEEIARVWDRQFRTSFRTRHFLVLITTKGDLGDQFMTLFDAGGAAGEDDVRALDEATDKIMRQFGKYGPRLLEGDDLATYWGWMLSGRHMPRRVGPYGLLDGLLTDTDLQWPRGERYQVYQNTRRRYSAWLRVKAPAPTTAGGFLESLWKLNHELSVFQSFAIIDKNAASKEVEDTAATVAAWTQAGDIMHAELEELANRLQADELSLMRHRFSVEVFGDSEAELERGIREVTRAIEGWRWPVARETANQEALFWSRFPGCQNWNPRIRTITSENAAHFAAFGTVGEGLESCSWGDMPVTVFKTTHQTEFAFTFHASRGKEALGHTLVVGGSEAGKTTLLEFLIAMSLKFSNMRVLMLDNLHGLEVFTHMMDGHYLDAVAGMKTNPLKLPDNGENRAFLKKWLGMLTGEKDSVLDDVVRKNYLLPREVRTLDGLADAFGLSMDGNGRDNLKKWLSVGSLGAYFSGSHDALEFDRPVVGIDMTSLLDSPEILAPQASYITHKMIQTGRQGGGGFITFVDEIPKYLKSSFARDIEMMLEQIRKLDGVFIGAAQGAGAVLDYERSEVFLNNIATYILFPEPKAKAEHYVKGLGLTAEEFDWVRRPQEGRKVLIKRRNGASVVVDVDLSGLGRYLKAFASGADAVNRCNELRGRRDDWKDAYLAG